MIKYSYSIILTIALSLLFVNNLMAQRQNGGAPVIWVNTGYSSLLSSETSIQDIGKIGVAIGGGYEWRISNFILQTGVEFHLHNSAMKLDDFTHIEKDLIDSELDPYDGKFKFTENKDHYRLGNLNIPLQLGFSFAKKYFFLAGGKLGINLFGTSRIESGVTSSGAYPQFFDDFENMPNHLFDSQKKENTQEIKTALNYMVSAELGTNLKSSSEKNSKLSYRISLFADYGLANIYAGEGKALIYNQGSNYYQPFLRSFLDSDILRNRHVSSLYTGIKLTILIQGRDKYDCRCNWN